MRHKMRQAKTNCYNILRQQKLSKLNPDALGRQMWDNHIQAHKGTHQISRELQGT